MLSDGSDDQSLWSVTVANSTYDFNNKGYTARYLRRNGTYGFAAYSSAGGPLSLYKLQAPDTRIDPNLSFSSNAITVAWTDIDHFVAPTLNNPYSVAVGYNSSEETVATIDASDFLSKIATS